MNEIELKREVRKHFNAYASEYESMIHNQFDLLIDYLSDTNRLVLQDATQDRADALKALNLAFNTPVNERAWEMIAIAVSTHLETTRNALSSPSIDPKVVEQVAQVLDDTRQWIDRLRWASTDEVVKRNAPKVIEQHDKAITALAPYRKSRED